jgi:protoporphyrinogen/coproporphyrinogen III oxidase
MKRARVVGAGLSGLAAAWHLADRGYAVTLTDRAARPGGLIHTLQTPHGPVETAANAFVWDAVVEEWFARLHIEPEFPLESSRRRYIFRNGRARRWPLGITESLAMGRRLSAAAVTRSVAARDDETIAAWADRVLGRAAREWLVEPAMQGIYASPASALSARAIFDGRKRGSRRLAAPQGGMGAFTARLCQRLADSGTTFEWGRSVDEVDIDQPTVIATDAHAASRLIAPHAPRLSARLQRIRTAPLTTATMFFEPREDDVRGFGVLFPARSGIGALGVLFNTDIFAHRGTARSETWIVGDRDSRLTAHDDDRLKAMVLGDRQRLTGRLAQPLAAYITRWPAAIPIYDTAILGIGGALDELPPQLALAGNYLGRIGVAALLSTAAAAVDRALRQ